MFLPPKPDAGSDAASALRQHTREIAQAVRVAMQGGLNVIVEVTLLPNAPSTPLADARIAATSFLAFMPLTASAAANPPRVAALASGAATLAHAASAATDQRFRVLVLG